MGCGQGGHRNWQMLGSDERLKLGFRDRLDCLGQKGDGWRRHGGLSRVWLFALSRCRE